MSEGTGWSEETRRGSIRDLDGDYMINGNNTGHHRLRHRKKKDARSFMLEEYLGDINEHQGGNHNHELRAQAQPTTSIKRSPTDNIEKMRRRLAPMWPVAGPTQGPVARLMQEPEPRPIQQAVGRIGQPVLPYGLREIGSWLEGSSSIERSRLSPLVVPVESDRRY